MRDVPFYSQLVNWNGEDSGFPNELEIARWEPNACGIASLRMIVGALTPHRPGYWELLQRGVARGAYVEAGWIHQGLVELARDYGLAGTSHRRRTVQDLRTALERGSLCIVSVAVGFRGGLVDPTTGQPFPKGGHLIVALGTTPGAVFCHHPSSRPEWNKAFWPVEDALWDQSMSGNFMEFPSR